MPIFYNKVQRKNPSKPADPAKWYPALRRVSQMKEKEVAKLIADETTLNPKEAEMGISQLQKVLVRALLGGQSVQLGDWGTFYLTLSSEGSAKEEDVSPANVKKINIRFQPGKELQEAIDKAEFVEASIMTK